MKGFYLIDKAAGMTSFDVVRKVKKLSCEKKVGHSGTLDPLATGLLLIACGEGTKLLEFFLGLDKVYEVTAVFGSVSDSYDADGEIEVVSNDFNLSVEVIESLIRDNFRGLIKQMPPKFSALKVGGRRACDLVRAGVDVDLKAREVEVIDFKLVDLRLEEGTHLASFVVHCGSGTYVRSLIHDLGQLLGCGAYVKVLRRVKISNFSVEDAATIDNFDPEKDLISLEKIVEIYERMDLTEFEMKGLTDGKVLKHSGFVENFRMGFFQGQLVGVLENVNGGIKFKKLIL